MVSDETGRPPAAGVVCAISNEAEAVIATSDEGTHGLVQGATVVFDGVQGMPELNERGDDGAKVHKVNKVQHSADDERQLPLPYRSPARSMPPPSLPAPPPLL